MTRPIETSLSRFESVADRVASAVSPLFVADAPQERLRAWSVTCLLAIIVLAAVLRFWGLGSFSLHKPDEDTTALPAVHILQDGTPRFPSGMFYARAIVQSYLIAASVEAFGQTEWAIRLPSVLCGLLVVALAYWMGRRFLTTPWNLAFVVCVACLPGMIADSQEARMYIFMIASLEAYTILIFEWERTGRRAFLVAAVAAMWVGIQFHQLVIFGSLVVLFPGLLHGDRRKLLSAVLALVAIGVGYVAISRGIGSFYPDAAPDFAPAVPQLGQTPQPVGAMWRLPLIVLGALLGLCVAWLMARQMPRGRPAVTTGALVLLGLISQAALYWHVALLLLLAAVIMARRQGRLSGVGLGALVGSSLVVAVLDVLMLRATGAPSAWKLAGMLVGRPSIWQYLKTAEYSPVAAVIILLGLASVAWQLGNRRPLRDYWLYFLLVAGIPLFGLGVFGWYFPPRYTEFALLPLLLVTFSLGQQWTSVLLAPAPGRAHLIAAVAALVACVAIVNPLAAARSVNAGASFPDHKSAAQFIRSVGLGPKDVVVAEEVLMQTYYLGHVDYWLQSPGFAASFVVRKNGQIVDEYTGTPVISTGAELRALIDRPGRGAIYVIGSGEAQAGDGRLLMRGQEISDMLRSERFKVVYIGPDRLTRIWRVDPVAESG
jgi:hypothetical protein